MGVSDSPQARAVTGVSLEPFGLGKRLVYFINDVGFFVSHRLVLARAAKELGFEVHVIGPDEPLKKVILANGLQFHAIAWGRWYRLPWHELTTLVQLFRLVRSIRPDVMHNVTIRPTIFGSLIGMLCRVKVLVNALPGLGYIFLTDSPAGRMRRSIAKLVYSVIFRVSRAALIVQNEDDRRFFSVNLGVRSDRIFMIKGSGVDLNKFSPAKNRRDATLVRVLFPARLLIAKGIREYLEAASKILAKRRDLEFLVAGDLVPGNPGSIPEAELSRWRGFPGINFLGHRDDMHKLLSEVDIVCLPSYGEGLPKALLEAAACQLPIVSCDVSGCREIVRDGLNGFLVRSKDAESLAHALETLIADREMRERFGKNGRRLVEDSFSEELVVEQTMRLYKDLLGSTNR